MSILCFISDQFADFEITLLFHKINTIAKKDVITVGYQTDPVVSESGLTYLPDRTLTEAIGLPDIEALIIPGGPIRDQKPELTELIRRVYGEGKLVAAICNGPQYLSRAGLLEDHPFTTTCAPDKAKAQGVPDLFPWANYVDRRVVVDGNIITATGRSFVDFTFAVFDHLGIYKERVNERDRLYADIMDRA